MQLALVGVSLFGAVTGRPSVAVNAAGALVVTALPALIRREIGLRMDPGLVLWLTVAVLLHAIGILGPYRGTWWWDYLTHAFSASILAGIGYAIVSSIDRHSDGVELPEPALTVVLFLLVVALGVLWEILEFAVTRASEALGAPTPLIVFGPADIVTDIVFTTVGGLLVVLWGRGHFRPLARKLDRLRSGRSPE